jgi:hypothetical protein
MTLEFEPDATATAGRVRLPVLARRIRTLTPCGDFKPPFCFPNFVAETFEFRKLLGKVSNTFLKGCPLKTAPISHLAPGTHINQLFLDNRQRVHIIFCSLWILFY